MTTPTVERTVFSTFGGGFGDCWAAASFLASRSPTSNHFVTALDPRICDILPHLEGTMALVTTELPATTVIMSPTETAHFFAKFGYLPREIVPWRTVFALPYIRTRMRWANTLSRRIAVQLQPSRAGPTSCEQSDIEAFFRGLHDHGFECIELGLPHSVGQNIANAASSACFVGIDSGMSHLCHSVGVPSILVRNRLPRGYLQVTHAGKRFIECRAAVEALQIVDCLVKSETARDCSV